MRVGLFKCQVLSQWCVSSDNLADQYLSVLDRRLPINSNRLLSMPFKGVSRLTNYCPNYYYGIAVEQGAQSSECCNVGLADSHHWSH